MTYEDYQPLAQRTSSTKDNSGKIKNGCLGLIGEAGEVVDVIKKMTYQGMPEIDAIIKIINEIGDVIWYCAELCEGAGTNLASLMQGCNDTWQKGRQNHAEADA